MLWSFAARVLDPSSLPSRLSSSWRSRRGGADALAPTASPAAPGLGRPFWSVRLRQPSRLARHSRTPAPPRTTSPLTRAKALHHPLPPTPRQRWDRNDNSITSKASSILVGRGERACKVAPRRKLQRTCTTEIPPTCENAHSLRGLAGVQTAPARLLAPRSVDIVPTTFTSRCRRPTTSP